MDIAQILEPIRQELALVEARLRQPARPEHAAVTQAVERLLSGGGKRIRPALALLAGRLYSADPDKVITLAAAVEMLHTATLVHDDLIDGARLRRGVPTINAEWTPIMTVLTGDYLFARAAYLAAQTDNVRVMSIFAQTLMTICAGELDQQLSKASRSRQDYDDRIYAKTAALLEAATRSAGVLAGAPEEHIQALSDYGRCVGLAFQIVDDVLDLVGDETTLGKPVGHDLAHGLVTLPTLLYLERPAPDDAVEAVLSGTARDPQAVARAVAAIQRSGAIEAALAEARDLVQRSQATLASLPDGPARASLHALAEFVIRRSV